MARVYADVNQQQPRAYWDYDSVNITWGVLENYEVVRKIGMLRLWGTLGVVVLSNISQQAGESTRKSSKE